VVAQDAKGIWSKWEPVPKIVAKLNLKCDLLWQKEWDVTNDKTRN